TVARGTTPRTVCPVFLRSYEPRRNRASKTNPNSGRREAVVVASGGRTVASGQLETCGQPNGGGLETLAERRRRGEKRAQSLLFDTARPSSASEKVVSHKLVPAVVS